VFILQGFFEKLGLMELTELTIVVRLLLALLFGGLLGLERTRKRRPAGMRTYMLVCIGSAVVMMTAQFMLRFFDGDPGRMPAQIISGIGFLGAGTIMVTRYNRVKGLTTAAGLWVAACMGIALGIGFYFGAIVMLLTLSFVMVFADYLESTYAKRLRRMPLFIIFSNVTDLKPFIAGMKEKGIEMNDVETTGSDNKEGIGLFCVLRLPKGADRESVFKMVEESIGVLFCEELGD